MNAVEKVKKICKEKEISLHKLEISCGFANGYIGRLTKGTIPNDRLKKIADYLNVSVTYLMENTEFDNDVYNVDNADVINKINENVDLLNALKKYFELSKEKQKYVIGLIELLND